MTQEEATLLVDAYIDGTISDRDAERLVEAIRREDERSAWILSQFEEAGLIGQALDPADAEASERAILERIKAASTATDLIQRVEARRSPRPARRASRFIWGACVAAVLLLIAYALLSPLVDRQPPGRKSRPDGLNQPETAGSADSRPKAEPRPATPSPERAPNEAERQVPAAPGDSKVRPEPPEESEPPFEREPPDLEKVPEPESPERRPPLPRETEPQRPALRVVKIEGDLQDAPDPSTWPLESSVSAGRGHARIILQGGIRLSLKSGTVLEARRAVPPIFFLSRGAVYCEVPPGDAAVRLAIETRDGTVLVKGTEFGVQREGLKTTVAVHRGKVSAESSGEAVEMTAGHGTTLRARRAPEPPEAIDADKAFGWRYEIDPEQEVLYEFDFEDGKMPEGFTCGKISARAGLGNRNCLEGTRHRNAKDRGVVSFDFGASLRFSEGLVLHFDYRLSAQVPREQAGFQVFNGRLGKNQFWNPPDSHRDRWVQATIRISDVGSLQENDPIENLSFSGGTLGIDPILIDNLRIVRYRPDRIPESGVK